MLIEGEAGIGKSRLAQEKPAAQGRRATAFGRWLFCVAGLADRLTTGRDSSVGLVGLDRLRPGCGRRGWRDPDYPRVEVDLDLGVLLPVTAFAAVVP